MTMNHYFLKMEYLTSLAFIIGPKNLAWTVPEKGCYG